MDRATTLKASQGRGEEKRTWSIKGKMENRTIFTKTFSGRRVDLVKGKRGTHCGGNSAERLIRVPET